MKEEKCLREETICKLGNKLKGKPLRYWKIWLKERENPG
jgi:hypothetical protein